MILKFIGADNSLGLKNGRTYDVNVRSVDRYIVVSIASGWFDDLTCPYSSPQSFAANWRCP